MYLIKYDEDFEDEYDTKQMRAEINFLERDLQEIKWTKESLRKYADVEGDHNHLDKSELEVFDMEMRTLNFKEDAHTERLDVLEKELHEEAVMWEAGEDY